MTTDTSERGLETLIFTALTGFSAEQGSAPSAGVKEAPGPAQHLGYVPGDPKDYDRGYGVDLAKLLGFLLATQRPIVEDLGLAAAGPRQKEFLARLQGEVAKRGVVDVLRNGVKHKHADLDLFYGTPSPGNTKAAERFEANLFSITRQLHYSKDESKLSLDLCIFINGLPVATFELKNRLTKQTVEDAVQQYRRDRDPRELIFQFGRCMVHFAVDDQEIQFCPHLKGKDSWFLPFNKGWNDGAGNPPNPDGLKADYLWREILSRRGLTDIVENYAQIVERKDDRTGQKRHEQVFPRYHQLDVVRKLLADVPGRGVGHRYLIQHSAGSGKSNSIAWLAQQFVGLEREGAPVFDSVIVVTDRKVLDRQIRDTIKGFNQVGATLGHVQQSGDLKRFLQSGKKIIVTTVQRFPFVLDEIGNDYRGRKFAILIDEAHSSQGGRTAAQMNMALSEGGGKDEEDTEDIINRIMETKKMLPNASYFAFTATPKNKTLEVFGTPQPGGDTIKRRPFHSYTMKQAIQEGFILDVLLDYTPVGCYYRLEKIIAEDPLFDAKKARKKLRLYVEENPTAIRKKAKIMVDHFLAQVVGKQKIGGQARAMVVTGGIQRAIEYFHAIREELKEHKSRFEAIVAFSGEVEYGGQKVTEAALNGFPSNLIADKIREDPYRFLVCADKFQTGYDEPLLHTMYVDKALSGIKAVQTLSRLNRAHPKKHDTFILDFFNDSDGIQQSFEPYYRTTILSAETDPNKLHDLKRDLDAAGVYDSAAVEEFVKRYLDGVGRDQLDPILDACAAVYISSLDEDGQVEFKGNAKSFVRTYGFLSSVLPFTYAPWEKLSIFLNFLIPKLPAPQEADLSKGILDAIDMDTYRVEVKEAMKIALADEDVEIDPVPPGGGGLLREPEMDHLTNILKAFNDQFGDIEWKDADKIRQVITTEIPQKVAADAAYQNAIQHSDQSTARLEHDRALQRVIIELLTDHTELFKQFSDNESFKRWLGDSVFSATYTPDNAHPST